MKNLNPTLFETVDCAGIPHNCITNRQYFKGIKMADWSHQQIAESEIVDHFRNGAKSVSLVLPTGGGKCFGKGTPILLHDGRVKPVEDVIVGDGLMGPDSLPRTVTSLARGQEMMYKVTPKKGMPYVVNESHILCLKITPSKAGDDTVIDCITVADYLKSTKWYKHRAKGWRTGVEYPSREVKIDPYFLGVWLGDGSRRQEVLISKPDHEIRDLCGEIAAQFGCTMKGEFGGSCPNWRISKSASHKRNPVHEIISSYGLGKDKFIPHDYLINGRETRLAILAGLLDSDGYLHHNGFDFISVDERLSNDLATLARSLGLSAYVKTSNKSIRSTGFSGVYWRVSISGDCCVIPNRIPRKKAKCRTQKKDNLVHGISVSQIGVGEYFGFAVFGPDRKFLLSDFTVVHNTRTAGNMMWKAWTQKGNRSIFVADRRELVLQPARAFQDLGMQVGITMADSGTDEFGDGWYRPDAPIQICSKQTLMTGRYKLPDAQFIVTDECHTSITEVYKELKRNWPNAWEIGLTATPVRGDGKGLGRRYDAIVTGATYEILQRNGVLVPVICKAPKSSIQRKAEGGKRPTSKDLVGDPVGWWKKLAEGRLTFAFSRNVAESKGLRDAFRLAGIPAGHVDGSMKNSEIDEELRRFRSGEYTVICNCNMLKYGVDVPEASCILINAPFGSFVDYRQAVGRVMRSFPGKTYCIVIDMAGAVNFHGFPDEDMEWSLDDETSVDAKHKSDMKNGKKPKPVTCPECYEIFQKRSKCPACGWEIPSSRGQEGIARAGSIVDVHRERQRAATRQQFSNRDFQSAWLKALGIAANRGMTIKAAAAIFRSNTKGQLPGSLESAGLEPFPQSHEWNMPVSEVYPNFVRRKATA